MQKKPSTAQLQAIKLFITDVDGVLTDGTLFYDSTGLAHKGFHVHDGMGLKYLQQAGIQVAVITACVSPLTRTRMEHLGIDHVFMGEHDKRKAYDTLVKKLNLSDEAVAYIGDDLPDLPLIIRAGVGITVSDACPALFEYADWITERKGGQRAIREVAETILTAQNHWQEIVKKHTS